MLDFWNKVIDFFTPNQTFTFSTKTRKPVSDVKIKTERIHFLPELEITHFDVNILDDQLNLFKNTALIHFKIEGCYTVERNEMCYFDYFSFVEKVMSRDGITDGKKAKIDVKLLPFFTNKKRKNDEVEYLVEETKISFRINLEYRLKTVGFGFHEIKFSCFDQNKIIKIIQSK